LKSLGRVVVILLVILLAGVLIVDFTCERFVASASPSQNTSQTLQTSVDGKNVTLIIKGNVSTTQISNFYFETLEDQYNNTHITFDIKGLNGSAGFVNMTIPKSAILGGTEPAVATNGGRPESRGFLQDEKNFYVWFTTLPQWDNSDRSYVNVLFLLVTHHESNQSSSAFWTFSGIAFALLIVAAILFLVRYKRTTKTSAKSASGSIPLNSFTVGDYLTRAWSMDLDILSCSKKH
jgi:flagellar biogenesis protein FliO